MKRILLLLLLIIFVHGSWAQEVIWIQSPFQFGACPSCKDASLVGWYDMEESSGTREDAHTTNNDLTDNATVGTTTGKVGSTAALFVRANSEYFNSSDPDFQTGDISFTFGTWVKLTSTANPQTLAGKWDTGSTALQEWRLVYVSASTLFRFEARDVDSSPQVDHTGTPSAGVWYFVLVEHDAVDNELCIEVNRGTPVCVAQTQGVSTSSTHFTIGRSMGTATYLDAALDGSFFTKKVLSTAEKDAIYNSGAGRAYSEL